LAASEAVRVDGKLSDRREHDRIDSEIGRVSKSRDPFTAAVRATRMPMLIRIRTSLTNRSSSRTTLSVG
jgi:hypothetical protein